ncbi:MAG: histidine--tRNA ligase [Defluviitaleaceae bacterium]|nr:histidine--tRNA ligase [Defluviitaleaceae bacterium]
MIQAPIGTRDIYGEEMLLWHKVETAVRNITAAYHFQEIRTPIIESTDLFLRGVGDTTDIVQKEMYTFDDKGGRSMSLRPELTAGVARAYIQHGLHNQPQPTKLWYIGPNFRYERPQAGRYRQHYQFGVEAFGSESYAMEAEIIALGWALLQKLNVTDVTVHINSIGCTDCRKNYHLALGAYITERRDSLCELCQNRADKNPLRVLDCKNPHCKVLLENAPSVLDSLDEACLSHFEGLQNLLTGFGIPFMVDPRVVRGLDYYTRTVFEFIGGNGLTVIGGGRYDGLVSQIGGKPTPAVGFGMGIDRLVILLKDMGMTADENAPLLYIGHAEPAGFIKSQEIACALREKGLCIETDLIGRSVKAQMKYADKIGAKHTMILGGNEIASGEAGMKNMASGEQVAVKLEDIAGYLK